MHRGAREVIASAGINLNPYQGLKLQILERHRSGKERRNQPKSLSGIETWELCASSWLMVRLSRNQPKSLSGIETCGRIAAKKRRAAGINLNPYQGLKQLRFGDRNRDRFVLQPEST